MNYVVKYKLYFHTYNTEIEARLIVPNGLSYFDGEMNKTVHHELEAVEYVRAIHKLGRVEELFEVPQSIWDSEWGEIGATSLTVLRCWIG